MLSVAFKEWAVICQTLTGLQSVILRKGGIAEEGGTFRAEHPEFLLYPTYFHEHRSGVKPRYHETFDRADQDKPTSGSIRFTHFVRVADVRHVTDLDEVLALDPFHAWTPEVVRQRFQYRMPGIFVLTIRTYQLPQPVERPERPEYAGCKTWVQLDDPISTEGAVPVLNDEAFAKWRTLINGVLIS